MPAIAAIPPETSLHDPQAERDRAGLAFIGLLANLSGGPPVLVVEDLQRADAGSLEVIRWLNDMADPPPCLIVALVLATNASALAIRANMG